MPNDPTQLLVACLNRESFAWEKFVDHFLPIIGRVVDFQLQEAGVGGETGAASQRDALVKQVFQQLAADDFALLRRYDASANLATYLSVIAQRTVHRFLPTTADPPDSTDHPPQAGEST